LTDILAAESAKWKVRIMLHFLQKELTKIAKEQGLYIPKGKSIIDVIHDDLRACPNKGIRKIYKKIIEAGSHMKENYQSATIIDLAPLILWVGYHDTAYRDPLFWIADALLDDKELKADIAPCVKQPKDWYCPRWHDTKENTRIGREKGEISPFELSRDELQFVPEYQNALKEEGLKLQAALNKQLRLRDREP